MRSNAVLAWRDGWLCAAETDTRSSEPLQDTWYWPLAPGAKAEWERDLGKPLYKESPSCYALSTPGSGWIRFQLPNGGQTKMLAVDTVPVPRPKKLHKTTETRWQYGHWEKYDNRKGWVRC